MESPIRTMVMRKNRKAGSRKGNRRGTRRSRVNRRNMYGGAGLALSPMDLKDTSMVSASKMSNAQGINFFSKHAAQHGGALMGAPVGDTGMLDSSLRASARMGPLDASYQAIVGMKDQSGGRRRRANRRATGRKSRRNRRNTRRQNGGMRALGFMETSAPGMLLSGSQAAQAQSTMNKDWALAENPSSFAPKLAGY